MKFHGPTASRFYKGLLGREGGKKDFLKNDYGLITSFCCRDWRKFNFVNSQTVQSINPSA